MHIPTLERLGITQCAANGLGQKADGIDAADLLATAALTSHVETPAPTMKESTMMR